MGVIKRQGLKQSVVSYIGVVIGMVNLMIYTWALTKEQLGLIRFLVPTAMLIAPFLFMGGNALAIRFFPNFKDEKKGHHGFLFFLLLLLTIGFTIFLLFSLGFQEAFIHLFADTETVRTYFPQLLILTFLIAYGSLFTTYTINFKRIVIPAVFNELFIKISQPLLAILFFYGFISFYWVVNGIVLTYTIVLFCLILYLVWLKELYLRPDFSRFKKDLVKEMAVFGAYGILGSMGNKMANRIDTFMIPLLGGFASNGIYFVAHTISNVIDIPRKALSKISSPILAQSLKDGDLENVQKLYQKSSITQFIFGLFILGGLWLSIDELFDILPNGEQYSSGKHVTLILGLAYVINMVTGVNEEIIGFSKYFRYKFYFIIIMAIANIFANFIFIPLWGVNGAAFATLLSMSVYNLMKFLLLKIKMDMQPFSFRTLWVVLIGGSAYVVAFLLPSMGHPFLDLILKSVVFTLIYGSSILYFKISPDINLLAESFFKKIKIIK